MENRTSSIVSSGLGFLAALFLSSCIVPPPSKPVVYPHPTEPYFTFILGGNLSEAEKSPDRYIGNFHAIEGQISEIKEDKNAVVFAVAVKTNFSVSAPSYTPFIVRLKKPLHNANASIVSYTNISKGDYISLIGFLAGVTNGSNNYGGQTEYLRFDAVAAHRDYVKPIDDYVMPQFEDCYRKWKMGDLWHEKAQLHWELQGSAPSYEDYEKTDSPNIPTYTDHISLPVFSLAPAQIKEYFDLHAKYVKGDLADGLVYKDTDCEIIIIGTNHKEYSSVVFYFDNDPGLTRIDEVVIKVTGHELKDYQDLNRTGNQIKYNMNNYSVIIDYELIKKNVPITNSTYSVRIILIKR